jgi:peptidase M50B-like protein
VTATSAAPSGWVVVLTGVFAVLVSAATFTVLLRGSHSMLVNLNVLGTAVHEAGHAAAACVTGGGVYQVQLTSAESGRTAMWSGSWLSQVATFAAGYAAPPVTGLAAASLLGGGHPGAVLAITVLAMAIILAATRDVITFGVVVAIGLLAGAALYWGPAWLVTGFGYLEAWLLLTSELGGLAHLVVARLTGDHRGDDADQLARTTLIPSPIWILGWFVLIIWAIWQGAGLMWPS